MLAVQDNTTDKTELAIGGRRHHVYIAKSNFLGKV